MSGVSYLQKSVKHITKKKDPNKKHSVFWTYVHSLFENRDRFSPCFSAAGFPSKSKPQHPQPQEVISLSDFSSPPTAWSQQPNLLCHTHPHHFQHFWASRCWVIDGVASPVHRRAIWQVAHVIHEQSTWQRWAWQHWHVDRGSFEHYPIALDTN